MKKFWVVWNEKTGKTTVKHDSLKSAMDEAERLASKEIGTQFHVLEHTCSGVVKSPVQWEGSSNFDFRDNELDALACLVSCNPSFKHFKR